MADRTFLIKVSELTGGKFGVSARDEAAGTSDDDRSSFNRRGLRGELEGLRNRLIPAGGNRRGATLDTLDRRADETALRELGQDVLQFLMPPKISVLFDKSKRSAIQARQGLRVHLDLTKAPSLAHLPWELAFDPGSRQHLCLMPFTPVHRSADAEMAFTRDDATVRLLGMVARTPASQLGDRVDPVQAEREQDTLIKALAEIDGQKPDLNWTSAGTRHELRRRLRDRRGWTVFHFIGHGDFDTQRERGYLVLDEAGGWDPLYADELLQMFADPAIAPQLVVLNCCSGASGAHGQPFSSVAATLVRGGIRAVIAMQFEISEPAAQIFSTAFYGSVSQGVPIGRALTEARQVMRRTSQEWVTPAFYISGDDFALTPDPGAAA